VTLSYTYVDGPAEGPPPHWAAATGGAASCGRAGASWSTDGSRHRWLALVPLHWQTLIVVDDATTRVLYAQLVEGESLAP
jgi:hypothetical protein